MEYIIASLVAILAATLIVYKLANSIFGLDLHLRPLLLCAACSMFISLVLPKIVVGFAGLPGTIAVLAVFAIIFAYFVARFEAKPSGGETESACCLLPTENQLDTIVQAEFAGTVPNEILNIDNEQERTQITGNDSETQPTFTEPLNSQADEYYLSQPDVLTENDHNHGSEGVAIISELEEVEELSINEQTAEVTNAPSQEIHDVRLSPDLSEADNLASVIDAATSQVDEDHLSYPDVLTENDHDSEGLVIISELKEAEELSINEQTAEVTNTPSPEIHDVRLSPDLSEGDNLALVINAATSQADEDYVPHPPSILTEHERNQDSDGITTISELEEVEELSINEQTAEFVNNYPASLPEEELASVQLIESQDVMEQSEMPSSIVAEEIEDVVETPLIQTNEFGVALVEEQDELMQKDPDMALVQSGVTVQEDENSIMPYNEMAVDLILPESEQLDDLVDFAFLSKERQDYEAALTAFRQALTLYPNSEAAPFLVVEVGNLLKNKGAYDEAIEVFSEGRNLCQTREDEMMEQEFISTIAYLRIIKNVLLLHRLGYIRFPKIPPHIVKEIDEEFKEWRSVGNI